MPQKHVQKSNRRIGKKYRNVQKIRRIRKEHRAKLRASRK